MDDSVQYTESDTVAADSQNEKSEEQQKQSPQHEAQNCEEDMTAWLQVLGAFCLNLNTWGLMNAYGVYQTYYELDLLSGTSSSNIAWIGSTQSFLLFVVSTISGTIFDAGYLAPLLWTGSALTILGMFMTSLCKNYWQCYLAQGITTGLGFGCLYIPAPAIVSQYFDKHLGLAMGAASAGSAIGGVIYPLIFARLQPAIGFPWTTRVIAFTLLATSLPPLVLMKSRAPPATKWTMVDRSAFRDVPYLLLNAGLLFGFMGLYIIFYYIALFALSQTSVSDSLARYMLIIINAASLPGRLIPGFYADRIGSIHVQGIVAFVAALLTFCLLAIRSVGALIVFALIYGFVAGAFMGLPAAGVVKLTANKSMIGTRLGMTLATVGVGVLVSTPIAGAILGGAEGNNGGSWAGLIGWCGALLVASGSAMAACRVSKVGWGFANKI